jgi:hypothetical protein
LATGRETALMLTDTQVIFVPDQVKGGSQGHLLFGRNSTLLSLRFDADRLQVAGEPVPVAKAVLSNTTMFCFSGKWYAPRLGEITSGR